MRRLRRIGLAVAGLTILAIAAALIAMHTGWGRELIRARVEAALADAFTGGAAIGRLDGSPLGELRAHDVVINGPDGAPAIRVGTLRLRLDLAPLLGRELRLTGVVADDVAVELRRDPDGALQVGRLLRPRPEPDAGWTIDLRDVAVVRGRIAIHAAGEPIHIDELALTGAAHIPVNGPIDARATVRGTWRERSAPFAVDAIVRAAPGQLRLPWLSARISGISVAGSAVEVAPAGGAPRLAGRLIVHAPSADLARLVPGLVLPGDVEAIATVAPSGARTAVWLRGALAGARMHGLLAVDLAARRAGGVITTDTADLAALSRGRLTGSARVQIAFDAAAPAPGKLPAGTAMIHLAGELAGMPHADATIAVTSDGERSSTVIGASGRGVTAAITAQLRRGAPTADGEQLVLERGRLVVDGGPPRVASRGMTQQASGLARATAGKLPVHGTLRVDATASGALLPRPDLAVTGTLAARRLRVADVSAAALDIAIDARQLPSRPLGRARLTAAGVARADMYLRELAITAANRADGKIQVALRTRPRQSPWLIEADALVSPGPTVTAVLHRHHVRAGSGADWTGTTGRLVFARDRIELRDLRTASRDGAIAVAGTYQRSGRRAGDLVAQLDVSGFSLDNLTGAYRGTLAAHVDVERRAGRYAGTVAVRAAGIALDPTAAPVTGDARIALRDGKLTADGSASGGQIGRVRFAVGLTAPRDLLEPAAWRRLDRDAVRGASVRVDDVRVDPALFARLGVASGLRGRASAHVVLAERAREARLTIAVRELRGAPIAQPIAAELTATIDQRTTRGELRIARGPTGLLAVRGEAGLGLAALSRQPGALRALPLAATLTIPEVAAPQLLAVFGRTDLATGSVGGTLVVGGTLAAPTLRADLAARNLQVPQGSVRRPAAAVDRITLAARWDGRAGRVELDGRAGAGTLRVVATGSPRALAAARLTLAARGFETRPLLAFAPGVAGAGAGRLDADLTVVGLDPVRAKVSGRFRLADARVPIAPTVGTLRRANLDVVIGERDIAVKLDGRLGGGTLAAAGNLALAGNAPTGGRFAIKLRKVSPIGVVEPVIDADITAAVARRADRWDARIDVRDATVVVPSGRGEQLKQAGAPPDLRFVTGEPVGRRATADRPPARPLIVAHVHLHTVHVESEELRGILRGQLALSADRDALGITGVIEADRGDLDLFGRRYQVERAAVHFDGTTDPRLDLSLSHEFAELTTTTRVRGRLSRPVLILSSDPSTYSQDQLLGFLLGGEPGGDPGDARDRATAAGASYVANRIGGYVRRALPIDLDVLRYEAATASSSAAITVGTWLTRNLFIAYRRRLDARPDENTGEGELEYWLSRRLVVEGVAGDRGYDGVDLLWRKRY